MAVKLRLSRKGRKKRPFYRIVAADSRSPRDGRCIEEIGYYNPLTDPITLEVSEDRALYWLSQGAVPTDTVKSLLRKKGITLRFELMKRGLPEEKIEEEMKKWEVLQLERAKRLAAKKEAEKSVKEEKTEEAVEAPVEEKTEEATPVEEPAVAEETSTEAAEDTAESTEKSEETAETSEASTEKAEESDEGSEEEKKE
ncbi:MAG: 30S ribosomal protein S16 [Calditrichaeota bacterium]|nr:MAG: 30S ribosomal protein S16 [Calditrichota bacterium]